MLLKSLYILLLTVSAGAYASAQGSNEISMSYGQNRFINKAPFEVKDSIVYFFLRGNATAKRVILSGSFSNWSTKAISMEKTDSGWIARIKLIPGKHLYKFIIDSIWNIDEDNLLTEKDDHDYVNSVYYKTNFVFTLPGFLKTKKVYLAANFNNWRTSEIPMHKTISGWEIPLFLFDGTYSYKFRADNEWHDDPKNRDHVPDNSGGFISVIHIGTSGTIKDLSYYQKNLTANEKRGEKNEIAASLSDMGYAYMRSNSFENARQSFERALVLYNQLKNEDSVLAMCLKVSDACRRLADMPCELTHLQKAIIGFEKNGNKKGLAHALRNMGYYNLNLGQWSKAAEYFEKALPLYERLGDEKEVGNTLGNLAHAYALVPDLAKQYSYIQRSMAVNEKIDNKIGLASNYWIISGYYKTILHDGLKSFQSIEKAYSLYQEGGSKSGMAEVLLSFAGIYLNESDSILKRIGINPKEKYARAIEAQKKSIQLYVELNQLPRLAVALLFISETYEKTGSFDSAFHYYKQYINLRERLFNTDKQKEITRLETKYDYEKKDDSLKMQQDLTDEKLQKQLLLFKQQQQQLALNQSQLTLSNKEKDLQHLAYLKMQADLQNEQLTKQQKEKENELQAVQVKSLTQKNEIIELNQQRQWIYIAGGFVLLALGFLYFIYRSRLRGVRLEAQLIKEKAEQERKETEFQHKLADVSMSALRSQMNPHFIFNCLNSIKLYTAQNNSVAASEYLTKFSKLIRLILENSRNERITLSSELMALKLYIEMEAMRFKEKLTYSLSVEKNVEADYIEIPPLLLQPYVENAIWHGLMSREDGGHITVAVSMQEEKSLLEINITDNGIGRAAATALNNKTASKHRSYGMKATTERIALINQIYKTGADVFVHDLVNKNGQAAGTQVTIQIPV